MTSLGEEPFEEKTPMFSKWKYIVLKLSGFIGIISIANGRTDILT